jgi:hypothetical protein
MDFYDDLPPPKKNKKKRPIAEAVLGSKDKTEDVGNAKVKEAKRVEETPEEVLERLTIGLLDNRCGNAAPMI